MRSAGTYRGARRNKMRATKLLQNWRHQGHDIAANQAAKINERASMANDARKSASIALVAAGSMAGPAVVNFAFLYFYSAQKRNRVVNRIISTMVKALPPQRKRAA
jgi:hypothetical protein